MREKKNGDIDRNILPKSKARVVGLVEGHCDVIQVF